MVKPVAKRKDFRRKGETAPKENSLGGGGSRKWS